MTEVKKFVGTFNWIFDSGKKDLRLMEEHPNIKSTHNDNTIFEKESPFLGRLVEDMHNLDDMCGCWRWFMLIIVKFINVYKQIVKYKIR